MKPQLLDISNIVKTHEGEMTLKKVSLSVTRGEILCLLGPSGCGKTTLLRIISGLEQQDSGTVSFAGKNLAGVPPHKRKFSMMFQEFALFPHKNLFENVAFGLRMQGLDKDRIQQRTNEMIELVGLNGLENRDIAELSGGERQRVALARSLAPNPRLLMLDEPMGSLDRALRERLVADLRKILKRVQATVIFVTHDQAEAFVLADRIAIFNTGYIEQIGSPETLYQKPLSSFIARFLGFQNLVPVLSVAENTVQTEMGVILFANLDIEEIQKPVLLIRPEAARLITETERILEFEIAIQGKLLDRRFQGAVCQVTLQLENETTLVFHLPAESVLPAVHGTIRLALKSSAMVLLEA